MRVQGVVPVAAEVVWEQTDGGHVRVGDLDIGGVDAVAFGMHAKARLGGGRRDQLDSSVTPLTLTHWYPPNGLNTTSNDGQGGPSLSASTSARPKRLPSGN